MREIELFADEASLPEGFLYRDDFISREEEAMLLREIEGLEFGELRIKGVAAKRRVAHYGSSYSFDAGTLAAAPPIPNFLLTLRQRVAELAGRRSEEFTEALVTDYPVGAPIGWHRDAPPFEIIAGVSLGSSCTMKFRRWPLAQPGVRESKPLSQLLEPRSIYLLRGPSRTQWQHHIPAAKERRVSITFRTLRASGGGAG